MPLPDKSDPKCREKTISIEMKAGKSREQAVICSKCKEENILQSDIEATTKCEKCDNKIISIPDNIVHPDNDKYKKANYAFEYAIDKFQLYTVEFWEVVEPHYKHIFNPLRKKLQERDHDRLYEYMNVTLVEALKTLLKDTKDIPLLNFWINKMIFSEEDIRIAIAEAAEESG